MLEPWNDPTYLTRAWCLFELYTAINEQERVEINIILTEEQHASFVAAMSSAGYSAIDAALHHIQSANATASRPADLAAIRSLIESKPGGFAQLDATVKQHLESWFVSHGAVQSADRIVRTNSSKKAMSNSDGIFAAVLSPPPSISCGSLTVGMRCNTATYGSGVVRFIGPVSKNGSTDDASIRIGIELDQPVGLNDGRVRGTRYFDCAPNHGVFIKPDKVDIISNSDDVFGFDDEVAADGAASTKEGSDSGYLAVRSE